MLDILYVTEIIPNYHPPADASPGRLRRACHRVYRCIESSLVSPPDGVSAGPCTSVAEFSAALQIEATHSQHH